MTWPPQVLGLLLFLNIYDKLLGEAARERTSGPLPEVVGEVDEEPQEGPDPPERAAGAPDGAKSTDIPVARQSDPVTSWQAADSIGDLTERQRHVLNLYRRWGPQGITDEAMVDAYHVQERSLGRPRQTDSGLRTRRSELTRRGLLEEAGLGTTRSGRQAILWRASEPRGNVAAEEDA